MAKNLNSAKTNAINKICKFMDDIESTKNGYNSTYWRNYLQTMNDKELIDFMKKLKDLENFNLFFELNVLDNKKTPTLHKLRLVSEKYNIPVEEYVAFPYKRPDNPDDPPISATKIPVLYTLVRPLQQLLDKKNNMSSDTDQVNLLTGQVTGSSKASTFSNMQTISLTTSNQIDIVKEFLGPRSDDQQSKLKMLDQIANTGDFDLESIPIRTSDKQSLETIRVMLIGAGFRVAFGKKAKLSYILPT